MLDQAAVKELDSVTVKTDRVRLARERYLEAEYHICPERGRLLIESWEETHGEPISLRRAKAFKKMLEGIPIAIREGEFIAGSQTKYVRGAYPCSEWQADVCVKEIETEEFPASAEEKKHILEEWRYWKGKSVVDIIRKTHRQLWGNKIMDFTEARMWTTGYNSPPGTRKVNYEKVLNKGLKGVLAEVKDKISKLKTFSIEEYHKLQNLEAMLIGCEALIHYAKRYSELARELAAKETDPTRKKELARIAKICAWVPENPARDFREALQSFWLIHLSLSHETAHAAQCPGRFDQYMYPFYERDVREGKLTCQEAAELLGCLWIKINEIQVIKEKSLRDYTQGSPFQNLTIGGTDKNGMDAVNELSYLLLEVVRQMRMGQPHFSLRYHDKIDQGFLFKAVETNRDHGAGHPAFFNDKVAVLTLVNEGVPLGDARDWAPQGCASKYPQNGAAGFRNIALNMPKYLEMALNNGVDPNTLKKFGTSTGDARGFNSFEQVYDSFKKQFTAAADNLVGPWSLAQSVRASNYAMPFSSALMDGCIDSGLDMCEGGMKWYFLTGGPVVYGYQNVANSLAAIKKLVFEDKKLSMSQLLDALASNFEGSSGEKLRNMLLSAPKFGNDDDYVDNIVVDLWNWTGEVLRQYTSVWGTPYRIGRFSVAYHYYFAPVIGALPDGKKAGEIPADGTLSPMRGTDFKGPTAVFNSATKVDAVASQSSILNMKFNPLLVRNKEGITKFLSLLKTYFDLGGYHVQFNILSREELLDAQKNPELHRDLLVRVSGFSVFFVELAPEIQDEIIARTEQEF